MSNTLQGQSPEARLLDAKRAFVADATGPKTPGFWVMLVSLLSGVGGVLYAALASSDPVLVRSILGAVGMAVVIVTAAVKLFHDKGVHIATIEALVKLLESDVPQLVQYLPEIIAFLENVWPNALSELDALKAQVESLAAAQTVKKS